MQVPQFAAIQPPSDEGHAPAAESAASRKADIPFQKVFSGSGSQSDTKGTPAPQDSSAPTAATPASADAPAVPQPRPQEGATADAPEPRPQKGATADGAAAKSDIPNRQSDGPGLAYDLAALFAGGKAALDDGEATPSGQDSPAEGETADVAAEDATMLPGMAAVMVQATATPAKTAPQTELGSAPAVINNPAVAVVERGTVPTAEPTAMLTGTGPDQTAQPQTDAAPTAAPSAQPQTATASATQPLPDTAKAMQFALAGTPAEAAPVAQTDALAQDPAPAAGLAQGADQPAAKPAPQAATQLAAQAQASASAQAATPVQGKDAPVAKGDAQPGSADPSVKPAEGQAAAVPVPAAAGMSSAQSAHNMQMHAAMAQQNATTAEKRDARAARHEDVDVTADISSAKGANAATAANSNAQTGLAASQDVAAVANRADLAPSNAASVGAMGEVSMRGLSGGQDPSSTQAQTGPAVARPDTPQNVAAQIAQVVHNSAQRSVELKLHPEELGRVSMTMSQDAAGGMTVALNVERADTLAMMRRHIDVLAQELRQMGYSSVDFSFQGGNTGQGGQNTRGGFGEAGFDTSAPMEGTDSLSQPLAPPTPIRGGLSGESIDIRL